MGISSYSARKTRETIALLREHRVPLLIHQPSYNMLNRWIEEELLGVLGEEGVGCIVFTPLAQGLLTDKYLEAIPEDSRMHRPGGQTLTEEHLSPENLARVRGLHEIARERGQSLAQMAVAWVLRDPRVTSAVIGASRPEQIRDDVAALDQLGFSTEELARIDRFAEEGGVNLWERPSRDLKPG